METVSLDQRLQTLAGYIRPNAVVADIGCDHGYLAVYLAQTGAARRVYASDLNALPLRRAQETVALHNVQESVTTLLSDGLQEIPRQAGDIVIAGMGGELIIDILSAAGWVCAPGKRLVLQPMSFAEKLRRYLYGVGFEILDETAVIDGRHTYCVLCAEYSGLVREISEYESIVGRMEQSGSPFAGEYLNRQYKKYSRILEGIEQSKEQAGLARYRALVSRLEKFKR